jgi:hypothetical protein
VRVWKPWVILKLLHHKKLKTKTPKTNQETINTCPLALDIPQVASKNVSQLETSAIF